MKDTTDTGDCDDIPITTECVLDRDAENNPIVEIDKTLVKKLKPHQIEGMKKPCMFWIHVYYMLC